MGCSACSKKAGRTTYEVTFKDGTKQVYSTVIEAKAAIARRGGTYKEQ